MDRLTGAGYPYLVSSVLASRGITTPEEAAAFLERDRDLPYSPFLMKDMDKAAQRVSRALADGEKIAVFGDYDVDGITATVILVDYLLSRGGDVVHYIPRRIEDGYGLGRDAILSLHGQGVRLLVTVDCGITGVEEVAYANSLGMDVVVTDHHECKEELPPACAVVDPHRLTVLVLRQKAPPPLADALMEAAASLCQALEGRSFRLAWNGPEGYESRTLGAQEQLAQALPELMKSPAQESDPPPWQEAGTVICLCCRVPPDLPENALVLRCSQQGGEPDVFTPEQMPQQIQQWIRSAQ